MLDLAAYLGRLGLDGRPGLVQLHRAHVTHIPFENLDPQRGVPVSLDAADLQRKLVTERRGGYCFEQNLVFRQALESLGLRVEPMLARVRAGTPADTVRPQTHLVLRVRDGGTEWHADVGFGVGTLREPIPFGPGGPYEQAGWRFRVVEEDDVLVLQAEAEGAWSDLYAFAPRPVPFADIELGNWFTSTHPASAFVTGLIVTMQREDGTRVSLSDWSGDLVLTIRTPERAEPTPVSRDAVPALLDEHFGLAGFALDDRGRIVPR